VQYAGEQRLQDSSKLFEATAENDSDKLRGTEAKEERSGGRRAWQPWRLRCNVCVASVCRNRPGL